MQPSEIEIAIRFSKQLEGLLEEKFGATGKGLHEKVSSVEPILPEDLIRSLRYIASVRNKVVHQVGYQMDDPNHFVAVGEAAIAQLRSMESTVISDPAQGGARKSWKRSSRWAWALAGFFALSQYLGAIKGVSWGLLSFFPVVSILFGGITGFMVGWMLTSPSRVAQAARSMNILLFGAIMIVFMHVALLSAALQALHV